MSPRQTLTVVMLLALLSSCGAQRTVYQKQGVTEEQRKQDVATCVRAAVSHNAEGPVLQFFRIDRDAYALCMENRGYAASRQ